METSQADGFGFEMAPPSYPYLLTMSVEAAKESMVFDY